MPFSAWLQVCIYFSTSLYAIAPPLGLLATSVLNSSPPPCFIRLHSPSNKTVDLLRPALAGVQNPGQVIRWERLKIPLKKENKSFRGYMQWQPAVSFWLHVPLSPHHMQTHAWSCSSLTPFKLSLGYRRCARHYSTVFPHRRPLLCLRMSLGDRGTEDATLRLVSFSFATNAPAKRKRPVVQNNPSLWQVLFAFLILVVSECARGSTETKMCLFEHLSLCSNAPWLNMNL